MAMRLVLQWDDDGSAGRVDRQHLADSNPRTGDAIPTHNVVDLDADFAGQRRMFRISATLHGGQVQLVVA